MTTETMCGRTCYVTCDDKPEYLLVQPVDDHDLEEMAQEMAYIRMHSDKSFCFVAVKVIDWNAELSPWPAPPVLGDAAFAGKAHDFLTLLCDSILPEIMRKYHLPGDIKTILGGYSLAGLFALWAGTQIGQFAGIAAVSPSVWFPGWLDYLNDACMQTDAVYLSLGGKEEKTRNPVMATVGDNIRAMPKILMRHASALSVKLEWNPGGHFRNAGIRTAKGFVNVMKNC